ncbi:hypothetical protein [Labrys monachus]|uniref:F5/8 type C domain-containing protein n=1 Tax=Labrys monachus TaxID=217067 RepID=A0ABU0FDG6_9HYPH|nr:hypothetical protein [Labrys monachus]MDQ0392178.1 hypothetical protein [Labrys monachus]
MTIYSIQATFGRGELTPKLHSRADLDHFKMGLSICRNWMVMRQGGLKRRPGTQFIAEVKDSSRPARLIPFIYNASQAYVLVLNAGVFRVYALGGRVGTVEVAHSYADADLPDLDYDQTNDVLDITHRAYQPQRISRLGNTSWALNPVATTDGPYLPLNATGTIITPSDTGNAVPIMTSNTAPSGTVTASGTYAGAAWHVFDGDPNSVWISSDASAWIGYQFAAARVIVGYSIKSGFSITVNDPNDLGSLNAPKSWTFEGSNDGTTWVTLDSQFGQTSWSFGETRSYLFTNTTAYAYYRLSLINNNGGTYRELSKMAYLEDPSAAAAITLTASSTTGINNNTGFAASDVGRYVSLLGSDARFHPFKIASVASTTVATAKATGSALPTTKGTQQWKLGAWSATTGWPAHVATFEGRKAYARTDAQPNGVWMTKSGGYGTTLDFSTTVPTADDDAITFTLTDVNEIQWIAESQELLMGTAGAARTLGRDSANLPFSASNFRQELASNYASEAVRPVKVGASTLFVSTFGKAMREFVRSDNGIDYQTPDISILSEHLVQSGIVELCYAQEPDSIVWLPVGNGELVGLTYEKDQSMAGMHHHQLGGDGFVECSCTIPGTDRNELWMIVRRTVNGQTRRYIERMAAPFEAATMDPAQAWYVDCGLQYSGAPVTSVSGLSHLEGETVSILADGARETDQVVTGGSVPLASGRAAATITVGLPMTSRARTLPSPLSIGDGSGLGRRKKVVSAKLDLFETGSMMVGRDEAGVEEIAFRATTDPLVAAPPLVTGFHDCRFASSWNDKGQIELIAAGPRPATLLSLTLSLETEP